MYVNKERLTILRNSLRFKSTSISIPVVSDDLDDICCEIRDLLLTARQGLKYNDIIERLKDKGSRATINKHLRHLEEKEYVMCKIIRTDKGRSTVYQWNQTPSRIITYRPPYAFLLIKIGLEIPEKSDEVHHILVYRFKNQSNDAQEYFGMHVFGDIPRSWKDLNPHIYEDEDTKSIEIGASNIIVRDDGLRKSISVKFSSPLYNGKEKTIRFEYDWEEPAQYWEYRKGQNLPDLFEFELIYPSGRDYELYVYEIDPLTQARKLSRNEPKSGSKDGKKFTRWQIEHPQIGQIFRFEWHG